MDQTDFRTAAEIGLFLTDVVPGLFVILIGLILGFMGLAFRDPAKYRQYIDWQNQQRGVQSNITKETIANGRHSGTILVGVGSAVAIMGIVYIIYSVFYA
jgi:hypothetical protein